MLKHSRKALQPLHVSSVWSLRSQFNMQKQHGMYKSATQGNLRCLLRSDAGKDVGTSNGCTTVLPLHISAITGPTQFSTPDHTMRSFAGPCCCSAATSCYLSIYCAHQRITQWCICHQIAWNEPVQGKTPAPVPAVPFPTPNYSRQSNAMLCSYVSYTPA